MLLAISGPSGAGKSKTIDALARLGFAVVSEPLVEIQDAQGGQRYRSGFAVQKTIVQRRARMIQAVLHEPLAFLDRSLDEDRGVFFPLYVALNFLTLDQQAQLEQMPELSDHTLHPAGFVLLMASLPVLRQRLTTRNAKPWLIDSLADQCALYEEWFRSLSAPTLQLNSELRSSEQLAMEVIQFSDGFARGGPRPPAI